MLEELVHKGPIAVGFEVYNDFMSYKNGVYHHTFMRDSLNQLNDGFDPFQVKGVQLSLISLSLLSNRPPERSFCHVKRGIICRQKYATQYLALT